MDKFFPHYSIGDFINEPGNPTQFEIMRFGEMAEPNVEDLHKHTFYEIIWIEEGASKQLIDFNAYEMACGSLFFISPGQIHLFEEWQVLKGGSVLFSSEFFLQNQGSDESLLSLIFIDNHYFHPSLHPDKKNFAEIVHTIDLIAAEKKRIKPANTILQGYLHVLMAQIKRCVDTVNATSVANPYVILYKRFQQFLESHFMKNETASFYADRLHVTAHHLNYITQQMTAKTATQVIRDRSVLEAKRLLVFTQLTVTEVAARLGYFDSSYFAKIFKGATQMTPIDFKRSMSELYRTL